MQGLDAGDGEEGVHRRERRAEIAQGDRARLHGEGEIAEILEELEPVIGGLRLGQRGKAAALRPVELAQFDHHAAKRIAVARQELGRRMDDDVGAMLDRPAEVGGRERVVDDQRQARLVGDLRHRRDVDHDAARIGEVLDEDRLAFRRQRAAEILRLGRIDEMAGPAELLERKAELGERAAIEVARGDELVAGLHQGEEGEELRRVARRRRDRRPAAFERGDPLLQHRDGRVGEPRIDVAEIVQIEERGGVVDVVEHIGRRLVDRGRARAGGRIGRGAGMDRAGLEAISEIGRRRRAAPWPGAAAAPRAGGSG